MAMHEGTMNTLDTNQLDLFHVLQAAFQHGVSDVHIKAGVRPMYRIDGVLRHVNFPAVVDDDLWRLVERITGTAVAQLRTLRQTEFSFSAEGSGRMRGHFYQQAGRPAIALRLIPGQIPSLQQLRLPAVTKALCNHTQGLVVVSGATGMGKSTTLASMLSHLAQTSCRHIITIEDPIEFVIPDHNSCVTQREVGRDVAGFAEGLVSTLRQDPDVILLGEVRDRASMDVALHAASTGHLVFTTLHFADALGAVNGIVGMAPQDERSSWRHRLAEALRAIIAQRLLPRRTGGGRVVATEVLVSEPTVRSAILDETKTRGLREAMARGRDEHGSHTMDQCLLELLEAQLVTLDVARGAATSPSELLREVNLRRLAV
jgi:twitching motility protein PilT